MGKCQTKTCNVCFKAMRSNNMERHMKRHKGKPRNEDNVVTNGQKISCKELENRVIAQMEEFERKIELGRKLKIIVNRHNLNVNGSEKDMTNALDTYELHGKNMDIKDIERRGWQRDSRHYFDKPYNRKVIWIVGKGGNEGYSFSRQILEKS